MFDSTQIKKGTGGYERILFIGSMLTLVIAFMISTATAQTAANTGPNWNGYNVTATAEFGWRFRSVTGSEAKYKSDLNYKKGFRSFDTNIVMESDTGKGKYFDSLLLSNSGWGSDPQGYTRLNMSKIGIYTFNANVRRVTYFNNLSNHALGEHTQDAANTSGDFDLVLLPQNEKLKFNFGASFSNFSGKGTTTGRGYRDDFVVPGLIKNGTDEFRAGVQGQLMDFDIGLTQGFRIFRDRTSYELTSPNIGNNPIDTTIYNTFSRIFPTTGHSYYTALNVHRTFAKKLDFTTRLIYTTTNSKMSMIERISGRDNSNNFIDLDLFNISALNKRIQARGDMGLTYMATDKFRISETVAYERFSVNGGEGLAEDQTRRNPLGLPLSTVITRSAAYRVNDYKRFSNTIEGDYQFNNSVSLHLGYRYTNRKTDVRGWDITNTSVPSATNPLFIGEDEKNSTHTFIAGMKIKPVKNWVIFWDMEKGTADNVFSRLENYKFTNLRVRTRVNMKKFALNLTAFSKDNTNPSQTYDNPPLNFGTVIKHRYISGGIDWNPMAELSISTGYTYHHLTSNTPIIVPIDGVNRLGNSQFFMRDNYAYFDISAKPMKRLSLFASYKITRDKGQGNRPSFPGNSPFIVNSYPMQMQTPEFRAAFRISRNVDWNIGYQYYNYRDSQFPNYNYKASLPYTSLRIYFGNGAGDR